MEKIDSARKQQMNIYSNRIKTSKKISNCAFYPVTPKQKTNLSIFDNEHDSKLIIRFLKANNCKQRLKKDEIAKLKIPDIQILEDSGVRGQTLSSK